MPWLGAILVAGAAALSRLVAVHLLPTVIVTTTLWFAIRAGAFDGATAGLTWSELFLNFSVDSDGVLIFVGTVFLLAALLQPFTISTVRLLEGYWGDSRFARAAARAAAAPHRRRLRRAYQALDNERLMLREEARAQVREQPSVDLAEGSPVNRPVDRQVSTLVQHQRTRRSADRARRLRRNYPPSQDDVLPTRLGNLLRAAERRAGERYYLPTVETLRGVYVHLSERLATAYNAAVDTLDAAAAMAVAVAISALISAAAFYDDPGLRWSILIFSAASVLSYRGAMVAAAQYGSYMDLAYDLHRFDFVRALHLDQPATAEEERDLAERLQRFFTSLDALDAQQEWRGTAYWHYEEHARPGKDSQAGAPGA